jgi:hypothetical protein
MPFLTKGKTNWKYILIVVILAAIVGGGILGYLRYFKREIILLTKFPEIKKPEKVEEEKKLEEKKVIDPISNVEIIAREDKLNKSKTDIFIKDLKSNKETFFTNLPDIEREHFENFPSFFRNGRLYILRGFPHFPEIWEYSFPGDKGRLIKKAVTNFDISPNGNFLVGEDFPTCLIFINLTNNEEKEFCFNDLIGEEMASYLEEVRSLVEATLRPGGYPFVYMGKWSLDSKDFWGFAYLCVPADPTLPEAGSVFKIDPEDWKIEKFSIPRPGKLINYLFPEALNLERELILFEQNINDGISLYLYDFRTKREKIIVSYSKEFLDKYFDGHFWLYVHQYVPAEERRELKPEWIDKNTFSYFDLETKGKVIKKVE